MMSRFGGREVSLASAARRMSQLHRALSWRPLSTSCRLCSSNAEKTGGTTVSIGETTALVQPPKHVELVPVKKMPLELSQSLLSHLHWMLQKDLLRQDMFLIGPPGPFRRNLAMMYCELMQKEVEYVSLSRDTTESDLKQRREIQDGTAKYIHQSAVRAALEGRLLILEGIEKAERNVLPVLNNLLENREMQLEDGRFLVAPERYDKLVKEYSEAELKKWKLERVNEQFRVIALGLPVPPYRGNPLDPPLRSRFQARVITGIPFQEHLSSLQQVAPRIPLKRLSAMLSVATTLHSLSGSAPHAQLDFPLHHLERLAGLWDLLPDLELSLLLRLACPGGGQATSGDMLGEAMTKFGESPTMSEGHFAIQGITPEETAIDLSMATPLKQSAIKVKGYPHNLAECSNSPSGFVETPQHMDVLAKMMLTHTTGDFCLVGKKGTGKTTLAHQFAAVLGYPVETVVMYQDMTARDLLQHRVTHPNGDTGWRMAPLVQAAVDGRLVLLEGIHRADIGTVAVLQRLIHDRELTLFGGERLMGEKVYHMLKKKTGYSDQDMQKRGIFSISDNFRIVGLAEQSGSPQVDLQSDPEFASMFLFHNVEPLGMEGEREVILSKVPGVPLDKLNRLLSFAASLRVSKDQVSLSLANSLSTRQLLRMSRRLATNKGESLYTAINKACLSRFLPPLARAALDKALEDAGIVPDYNEAVARQNQLSCSIQDGMLTIGTTQYPIKPPHSQAAIVPDILFYDNQLHLHILQDMLKDYALGEHLLLVGNQGVGKNKIADRFLQLLNLPREYLQLHRDTTVQTLTLQSSVLGGQIVYEDSPLVRAVKHGLVLVVDEADKAPTHVTCVLQNLIKWGEMALSDGRKIVPNGSPTSSLPTSIPIHPDFRMVFLANRPGFPFLGNDFFAAMGDMFSCYAVDNPDLESEMAMLRQYGPDVPDSVLRKLVAAFAELRGMADDGLISYPYSTREVTNMVRHLQHFPGDSLSAVLQNVFAFDSYHNELKSLVVKTLHKHGIPIGASPGSVKLADQIPLPPLKLSAKLKCTSGNGNLSLSATSTEIKLRGPFYASSYYYPMERSELRGLGFSETKWQWKLDLDDSNFVTGIAAGKGCDGSGDIIHVTTGNPLGVYSMSVSGPSINFVDLYGFFHHSSCHLSAAALGGAHSGKVMVHNSKTNEAVLVDFSSGNVWTITTGSMMARLSKHLKSDQNPFKMHTSLAGENVIILQEENGDSVSVLDLTSSTAHQLSLPVEVKQLLVVSPQQWIVEDSSGELYLCSCQSSSPIPNSMVKLNLESADGAMAPALKAISTSGPNAEQLKSALQLEVDENTPTKYSRLVCSRGDEVGIAAGFPVRPSSGVNFYSTSIANLIDQATTTPTLLPDQSQVIIPCASSSGDGMVHVVDLVRHSFSTVHLPKAVPRMPFWRGRHKVFAAPLSDSSVAVVDAVGSVTVLETGHEALQSSFQAWKQMMGQGDESPLRLTINRDSGQDVSSPKHGKVDPNNAPHVGGNTWAGGTGGRDTAGLGGRGGPYRLDAGHTVYQVSDAEKDAVPDEVKKAAREMGEKAFKKRLQEIQMSEHDAALYAKLRGQVQRPIQSIRVILDSLQAKGLERQWVKHQTTGDLDDAKLIEGLTGEKSIFKRRGEKIPEFGSPQLLPKRIRLVVDVSGSMYRFNSHDRRLERMLQAVLMVMEAFEKHDRKFKLDITGHSGDSPSISFVSSDAPPANDKERLAVLETMHAHSQFCWPGDHTLEATQLAVSEMSKEPADESFVIVLSDANFSRYRINPDKFATVMLADPRVNVFAVFIGSLGDQAQELKKKLPRGRSFVCMDNAQLPQILQQIFTSTLK